MRANSRLQGPERLSYVLLCIELVIEAQHTLARGIEHKRLAAG